jgi:type VI secretion system secreted protein VgrG
MAESKQSKRLMTFSSPLGEDVLLIESLEGSEGISRLFEFHVELLADAGTEIQPASLMGAKVTVAIGLTDIVGSRYINGIVAAFEQGAADKEYATYHARIVPGMWQLTLTANCRVFQNKTVLEIVKSVLGEYGLSISDQTSQTYKPLDYCTQYSETDLHFVSRLLEESGIGYWFEHTSQEHKIILADSPSAYSPCPLLAEVPYALNTKGAEGAYGARVIEFSTTATMVPGQHTTADFDFRPYERVDSGPENSTSEYGDNGFDQYLYPAGVDGYLKKTSTSSGAAIGSTVLAARARASDATAEVFHGTSNSRAFCPGYTYTLKDHPRDAWNHGYLLTSVSHYANQQPSYRTKDDAGGGYSNRFSSVKSSVDFKAPRTAVKPVVCGPQTALVVAPSGEDMYIDKLGRVCVQFFWDKQRPANTIDNTWVRVGQFWAGNGWGTFFWPRINDEVIVAFLNGDPDNPVIVGSVYNGVNVPKYALPDHSTRSGLVTRSSKGGSAANANELRFEDKTGSEQIFLNAEKDMDHRVENDHRMYVGGKDSLIVTANQLEQIGGDYNREVKGNSIEKIGGNSDLGIGGNQTEQVGGNHALNVGSSQSIQVGTAYSMNAGQTVYINGGMNVVIQAGMQLSLVGPGGFVSIGPEGVSISGTMVLINSGGAAGSGSPGQTPSPQTPTAPDKADDGSKGGKM